MSTENIYDESGTWIGVSVTKDISQEDCQCSYLEPFFVAIHQNMMRSNERAIEILLCDGRAR